jgi:hypothetical protein
MWDTLANVPSATDQKRLVATLHALDTRAGALLLTGRPIPVSWLSPAAAEELVQRWKKSRLMLPQQLAALAVSLSTTALYGHPGPEWGRIGYQGPVGSMPRSKPRLAPVEVSEDAVIDCDVVIVGSGAGGGCVAAGLARAGLDVVVLDKGGYFSPRDFHHIESKAMREMYLYGATLSTADLGCRILAGSAIGGGTLVNYTTAFRTPEPVLKEWGRVSGVEAFINGEIEASLDEVCDHLGVTFDESEPGRRDALMEEGCQKLGWHIAPLPRAVKNCRQDASCGFCGYGCRVDAKQGTMKIYLDDAVKAGARIYSRVDVRKVTISDGRATGVQCVANGHKFVVNSKAVIAAAGAIETPALLLRSGLRGEVGKHLHLHGGTAAWGFFDEEVRMWEGTLQARYCAEFANRDGGYGPIFETVPIHPGAGGAAFPWLSAEQHRELMDSYKNISFVAVLPRDESSGRVTIRRDGSPKVEYKLNPADERRITEGVISAAQVVEAAGAHRVHSPHHIPIPYQPGPGAHDRWADEVRQAGMHDDVTYFSYHQMGSCRMGIDPGSSAVGPDNESHEVKNLFVTDSSTFPLASGVNPMVSIYGIANRAAKKIAARFS